MKPETRSSVDLLSPTYMRVLIGVARGHSTKRMSEELGVTTAAICGRVSRILGATGQHTRAGAIGYAYREGLLAGLEPEERPEMRLTPRRSQILHQAFWGMSNAQIGRSLHVSEANVQSLMKKIVMHLRARNRAHAVAIGCQHGLIDITVPAIGSDAV